MQSQAGSQDACVWLELVTQLTVKIHLDPASAVLGQTQFLLRLLADRVPDRLWLRFSCGLRVQGSVKTLPQPIQQLPSTGERANAIGFLSEKYFSCRFVSGPQPALIYSQTADSAGLST